MAAAMGLIETMYVQEGMIALESLHRQRLERGIRHLGGTMSVDAVFAQLYETMRTVSFPEMKLRLELYPQLPDRAPLIECKAFSRASLKGIVLGLFRDNYIKSFQSTGLKTTQRDIYVQALAAANVQSCDDLILLNERGECVETGIYNILWRTADGRWYTPPLSSGCVAGVQRAHLIASGILVERSCTTSDLQIASAIRVCNALRGILPVERIIF